MSNLKTGLMFSPLTEKVYWGRMNTKTGVSVGANQKDITSDFISIMLQKFPINTRQSISCNGKGEAVAFVVNEKIAARLDQSKDMLEMLEMLIDGDNINDHSIVREVESLLEKARGVK